jgi:integrase
MISRFDKPSSSRQPSGRGSPTGSGFHDLRHTCASLLIAQGASVKAVQAQLGHASATVTLDRLRASVP